MNQNSLTENLKLKALILYCCPESGHFLPLDQNDLPAFFDKPDLAVSDSACSKGWVRKLAQSFKTYVSTETDQLLLRLNTYDLIMVYPLSLNTLAKFALGIQDSFPSKLLFEAAMLGKPILLNDQFIPSDDSHMNPHLIRIYRQHWERILSGTIRGFNLDNLAQTAVKILRNRNSQAAATATGSRTFITREDIIQAAESLEPMKLPPGAIVTDLAREEAKSRGVIIVQG